MGRTVSSGSTASPPPATRSGFRAADIPCGRRCCHQDTPCRAAGRHQGGAGDEDRVGLRRLPILGSDLNGDAADANGERNHPSESTASALESVGVAVTVTWDTSLSTSTVYAVVPDAKTGDRVALPDGRQHGCDTNADAVGQRRDPIFVTRAALVSSGSASTMCLEGRHRRPHGMPAAGNPQRVAGGRSATEPKLTAPAIRQADFPNRTQRPSVIRKYYNVRHEAAHTLYRPNHTRTRFIPKPRCHPVSSAGWRSRSGNNNAVRAKTPLSFSIFHHPED